MSTKTGLTLHETTEPARPYWRVDIKWLLSLILCMVLGLWLLLFVAYRATSRDVAVELIGNIFKVYVGSIPTGQDGDRAAIDALRQKIADSPTKSIEPIPGSVITEADLNLSPAELRDKIFSPIIAMAGPLYDIGARKLAEQQSTDKAQQDKFVNDTAIISLLSKENHERIGWWVLAGSCIVLALLIGAVLCSYRFGKLVTPGVVLLVVGLPGLICFGLLTIWANQPTPGAGVAQDYLQALSTNKGALLPFLNASTQVYLVTVLAGLSLLAAALLGRISFGAYTHLKLKKAQAT